METIGWIGSICFAICGLPLAIQCYKDKHASGVNNAFLALWFTGEVCTLIYSLHLQKYPLILNYTGNLILLLIVIYYKFYGNSR